MKDRRTLRKLVGVKHITTVTRSGRLKWHGYVMTNNVVVVCLLRPME